MNWLYGFFLCVIFGVMAAGQILGFLGLYSLPSAVFLSVILIFVAAYLYGREHPGNYDLLTGWKEHLQAIRRTSPLEICFYAAGILLFTMLIALPLLRWPLSPIGRSLTWDAGAYHFPKAVELFRSGSAWDLTVAYGEYPFGYESLLSLCLSLTGDASLFGWVHLFICIFFCLTIWKLADRYTSLPRGLLFFFSVCLLVCGTLPGGERTWLLSGYALTIGKNDFLLGAATLAVILHSPIGPKNNQSNYQLLSFALASMIALAVKPNALTIVAPLALLILWTAWKKSQKQLKALPWIEFLAAFLVVVPGILWAIRNLLVLGAVATPASAHLASESIAANLANPYLYTLNSQFLILVAVLAVALAGIAAMFFIPSMSLSTVLVNLLLLISFIITPATAFHRQLDVPSHIAWRFGVALLSYSALILLMAVKKPLDWLFAKLERQHPYRSVAAVMVGLLTLAMIWRGMWLTRREPQNAWILHDQFSEEVGVDGYYSAYDYVQTEIHHAVIHVENGLAYYLYGSDFSNTPTKLQYPLEMSERVTQPVPQYFVIFRPDWQAEHPEDGVFPASLEDKAWLDRWQLIYDDGQGRVYRATP